ncbi:DUF6443 domain-containing protein [Chryseobacterium sp. CBTAP 102]|uniref:DUF6443 domain-containing protein n=1 Tax=Chryseobacterium sp. CBTAP 102 TaxID=2135644 RepID=UPI001E4BF96A|nr:DUF6443 domain-containing protein [Chryseobacterium sp. CBTAP 102]
MKKILLLSGLFSAVCLQAQKTTTENYISTTDCLNEDCSKKTETVQYFDLLGRPKQVVSVKATPLAKDIVTPVVYDDLGRQTRTYLAVPQSSTSNGAVYPQTPGMVSFPVADATGIYAGEKTYTEKILEKSPLERVLQQKPIGNDWNGKAVVLGYDLNTAADHVKNYQVTVSWDPTEKVYKNELQYNAVEYAAGKLVKNTVTDEDGHKVVEFKDATGQTILSRKVIDAVKNADTYYVYNDYKQLAYVIPPLASAAALSSAAVDNICYQYKYDSKNRLAEKKLPGKGWEYMVYDRQNRLVASQDANLKEKGQWMYTKYDQFGRAGFTGIATGGDRKTEQGLVDGITNNNVKMTSSAVFNRQGMDVFYDPATSYPHASKWVSLLSVNYYDSYPNYSFNPAFPQLIQGIAVLKDTPVDGKSTKGLSVMSFVKNIEDDNWTKNYIYYDQKGRTIGSYAQNHLGGYTRTELDIDFAGVTRQSKAYHKRLSSDPEKVITQTFTYDQQNRLLVHKHQVDTNPEEILVQNEYNELSQLKNKKLGGTTLSQPLQSINYTYNIRGWLTKINDPSNLNGKLLGYEMRYFNPVNPNIAPGRFTGNVTEIDWKNASEDVLKRYNYAYDGLGRLQDAVYSEPNATVPFNNNYNEHLTYDLNGNIKTLKRNAFPASGSTTSAQVDDLIYNYTGNLLTKVTENALNDTGYEGGNNTISYDLNGNMKDMLDKGIQSIQYNHLNLSNGYSMQQINGLGQLLNSTMSYLYRADGTKLRKTYSSTPPRGSTTTRITDYLDGFQYSYTEGGGICLECRTESAYEQQAYKSASFVFPGTPIPEWKLDFVATAEGFYSFTENRYIYQYRDHLGNARVTFAKSSAGVPEIIDTNNYYPFGLNHISGPFSTSNFGSFYSYKYNGKELQETGMYDYGARMLMPDLGRWGAMDAMSEKYSAWSPYNYAINNPAMVIDPDGNDVINTGAGMTATGADAQFAFKAYVATMSTSTESSGGNIFTGLDNEYDRDGKMISNLGGNKIDFYHQRNGDTKVVSRQTGASNIITGGESIIRGYTHRGKDIGWGTITIEYFGGSGPARSLFSDFNDSNDGPFASLDKASSPYSSLARQASLNSQDPKGFVEMTYLQANPIRANFDGYEQMWGRSTVSWYKLGDETLFLMLDSKSQESLFYRLPVNNFERTEGKVNSFGNTYQTYMWTESNSEVQKKVINPTLKNVFKQAVTPPSILKRPRF